MASPQVVSNQTLRIVDANLNRIGEGLRLLEDTARLLLDNAALSQQLKSMRHRLEVSDPALKQRLLQARNAAGDVGINLQAAEQAADRDLASTVIANTRRVQQSLRVIEEMAKIPAIQLDSEVFKKARFDLYTIERELTSRLLRRDKVECLRGLYAVIDTARLKGCGHKEMAEQLIEGGASAIQLRDKTTPKNELLPIAIELQVLCAEKGVLFIVNDHLDIALAAAADGLHIGPEDLPLVDARRLLPIDRIIGYSATSADQATAAEEGGADYVAASGVFATDSKEAVEPIGLSGLRQISNRVKIPVVAIGGINPDNAAEVLAAGAVAIAAISALLGAESPVEAARQMAEIIEKQR